jgi:hypothetical protein
MSVPTQPARCEAMKLCACPTRRRVYFRQCLCLAVLPDADGLRLCRSHRRALDRGNNIVVVDTLRSRTKGDGR